MGMKLNRVWLGIIKRQFVRWLQSLLASKSTTAPTVPSYKGWTETQQRLEEESYLASPHAVWLKPDRFETRLWMEGIWQRPKAYTPYGQKFNGQWQEIEVVSMPAGGGCVAGVNSNAGGGGGPSRQTSFAGAANGPVWPSGGGGGTTLVPPKYTEFSIGVQAHHLANALAVERRRLLKAELDMLRSDYLNSIRQHRC